jgi:hypothetical protein
LTYFATIAPMGKIRQIFVWDGHRDLGPFRRDELVEQLRIGVVLPSHFYFEEGMKDWARVASLPCCVRFLASDAQKEMLTRMGIEYDDYLTKNDVSRILEKQPATERQLALLAYLNLPISTDLTKNEASDLLEAAKRDASLGERLDQWNYDRLELHADIYATERATFKLDRIEIMLGQYRNFKSDLRENGGRIRSVNREEMIELIAKLDAARPGWDRQIELNGLDQVLDLLKWLT